MNRAYVPLNLTGLQGLRDSGLLAAEEAYAVTTELREAYAATGTTEEEDLEYVALTVAARVSLTLLDDENPDDRRRIVVSVDAETETGAVPLARVASVHVDTDDLQPTVEAAVQALPAAAAGDPDAVELVEALDGEDLAWYAVQEIPDLLGG